MNNFERLLEAKQHKFINRKWPEALKKKVFIAMEEYVFIPYDDTNFELELHHYDAGQISLNKIMRDVDTVMKKLGYEQNLNVDMNKWMLRVTGEEMAIYTKNGSHDVIRIYVDTFIPKKKIGTKEAEKEFMYKGKLHLPTNYNPSYVWNGTIFMYYNKATDIQGPIASV